MQEEALERGYEELAVIWDEVHDREEADARRHSYAERVDRVMPG
jgi:hypothetical protein